MTSARPLDTDPDVCEHQVEFWRAMTPEERSRLALRLCDDVTTIAVAGIRLDHSDATPDEIAYELCRRRYGQDLADEAYGRLRPS